MPYRPQWMARLRSSCSRRATCSRALIASLGAPAIADAVALGWLAGQPGERLRITEAGLRALRRARTQAALAQRAGARDTAAAHAGPPAGARPQQADTPLAWLRRRKDKHGGPMINEAQHKAGERLASDYHLAAMLGRVTTDWSGVPASRRERRSAPGTAVELSDRAAAARDRLHRALRAVGPELGGLLVEVCCHDIGLEAAEQVRKWPKRTAKIVLCMALTALARHYGYIATAPAGSPGARNWMAEGYAPSLEGWR